MDTIACSNCSAQVVAGWPRCQRCGEPQTGRVREADDSAFAPPAATAAAAMPPPLPLRERLIRPKPPKPPASVLPHVGWMPVVAAALAAGFTWLRFAGTPFDIWYLAGFALAMMILPVLLGWLLLFTTKRVGVAWSACLGLLFALMLLMGAAALFKEAKDRRKLYQERRALIELSTEEGKRLAEGRAAESGANAPDDSRFADALVAPHSETEVQRFITATVHRALLQTRDRTIRYQVELAAIDLTDALTADKLVDAKRLAESRRRLIAAHALFDAYYRDMARLNEALERDIAQHVPRTPEWQTFWAEFTPVRERRNDLARRMGANQSALLDEMKVLVDFMETQLGRASQRDGLLYLPSVQAEQTYTRHMEEIERLAAEEKALAWEEQQNAKQALQKLQ